VRVGSAYAVVAGALLAGVFVARAVTGVPSAWAYAQGRELERSGRYAEAGPVIDRGAVGANRTEALWRAGRSRLEDWDTLPTPDQQGPRGAAALGAGAARFLAARAESSASAWFTAALGDVYARRESAARANRTTDLALLDRGPWALVGDDGRIAIGLARAAIDREPNRAELRDQLVWVLQENGLHEEASRAMAESARVLPDFNAHPSFAFETLPRDLVETFWKTARGLDSGDAPLLPRERYVVSLGQLGHRLGHLQEAEHDLRTALNEPATKLALAEEAYHLGLVLVDQGRFDEAESMFARALEEPVFGPGVARMRAYIAERQERWPEALAELREARRLNPRDLWVLLEFARVARHAKEWDQAEEALRWAARLHRQDPAPSLALVELFLAKGEKVSARHALDEHVRSFGQSEDAARMDHALAEPLDPVHQ